MRCELVCLKVITVYHGFTYSFEIEIELVCWKDVVVYHGVTSSFETKGSVHWPNRWVFHEHNTKPNKTQQNKTNQNNTHNTSHQLGVRKQNTNTKTLIAYKKTNSWVSRKHFTKGTADSNISMHEFLGNLHIIVDIKITKSISIPDISVLSWHTQQV